MVGAMHIPIYHKSRYVVERPGIWYNNTCLYTGHTPTCTLLTAPLSPALSPPLSFSHMTLPLPWLQRGSRDQRLSHVTLPRGTSLRWEMRPPGPSLSLLHSMNAQHMSSTPPFHSHEPGITCWHPVSWLVAASHLTPSSLLIGPRVTHPLYS